MCGLSVSNHDILPFAKWVTNEHLPKMVRYDWSPEFWLSINNRNPFDYRSTKKFESSILTFYSTNHVVCSSMYISSSQCLYHIIYNIGFTDLIIKVTTTFAMAFLVAVAISVTVSVVVAVTIMTIIIWPITITPSFSIIISTMSAVQQQLPSDVWLGHTLRRNDVSIDKQAMQLTLQGHRGRGILGKEN